MYHLKYQLTWQVKEMQFRENKPEENKRVILQPDEIYEYSYKNVDDLLYHLSQVIFLIGLVNRWIFQIQTLNRRTKISNTKKGKTLVNNLLVVNDVAENGIKLMEDYNNLITKNEKQK